MKNTYTHIEEAIKCYQNIYSYKLESYIELVCDCIGYSKNRISLFCEILNKATMEDTKLYYKKNDQEDKYFIYANPTEEEINKLELQQFENIDAKINSEIKKLPGELKKTRINVLLKALFLAESILPNKSVSKDDNKKLISVLKQELGRDEDIRLIIQYSLLKADPSLLNRIVLKECITFFFHLIKSLLNGEYLILPNYSSLITENINFKGSDFGDENTVSVVHLYLEKSYAYFANCANEMCYRLEKILESKRSNHINLEINDNDSEIDIEKNWGWIYVGKEITRPFELFIKSIINMTIIDHAYKTKDRNILELLTLRAQIKSLKLYLSKEEYADLNDLDNFNAVLNMTQFKLSNLLFKMLKQKQKDEDLELDYYFTFKDENQHEIISSIGPYIISDDLENENPFIKTRKEYFNRKIDEQGEDKLLQLFPLYNEMKDVKRYDTYVKEGIKSYCKISHVMEKIKENTDDNTNENAMKCIIKICHEDIKHLTPALFVKAIQYVTNYISNLKAKYADENEYINKLNLYVETLSNLINKLDQYILQFNKSVPYRYLPPFNYSFYEIDTTKQTYHIKLSIGEFEKTNDEGGKVKTIVYNKDDFKNKFFFASVGCTPMNFEYLKRFSSKYNVRRREYSRDYYNLVDDRIKNSINESKAQTDKFISLESKYMEAVTEQRHQTMQILGIFAAFLAFVTITVGLIKVATTIHEFILFCVAFTLSLLLFATHLRNYTGCKPKINIGNLQKADTDESQNKSPKKKYKSYCNFIQEHSLILFLSLILFCMLFLIPIKRDEPKEDKSVMEQTLIIDHSNNQHKNTLNSQSEINFEERTMDGQTINNKQDVD